MFKEWLKFTEAQVAPEGYRGIIFIMKGVPGSGKSFDAKKLADDNPSMIFSADKWFEQQPGGYQKNWSLKLTGRAHQWCQDRVREAMRRGVSKVIVDNTNLTTYDAKPYVDMAHQYQYWPEIKESSSPWWIKISELLKNKELNANELDAWANKLATGFEHEGKEIKNTHGVPAIAIRDMLNRYQPYTVDDL